MNRSPFRQPRAIRALGILSVSLACMAAATSALAQDAYPDKLVKIVVNFPAGGPLDIIARSVGNELQKTLKQTFVVENRPGAAGNIGADQVAKSKPDGYTVLFTIDTPLTVNPHIYKSMPFTPQDFRPVVIVSSSGLLVGVHPRTGLKTLPDLVAAGKSKGVSFASAGGGSPGHLAAEVFRDATGMQILHVPYRGNAPAVNATLSGEVDGGVLATPGMMPHVKAGKITALAVTSRQRSVLAPDVPTVAEAGHPEFVQEVLYMAMVPAATPQTVVDTLVKAMEGALAQPEFRQRLGTLDMFPEGLAGAAASKRLQDLSERYGRVIKATGMTAE